MHIAITGHRPNKLGNDYTMSNKMCVGIRARVTEYVIAFQKSLKDGEKLTLITGMALGIDQMFAEIAISLNIPFIAAIPFKNQDRKWPEQSRTKYLNLLAKAHEIINVSGADDYKIEYMQDRNIWMVQHCDILIAVWDGTSGGTKNCVDYADLKRQIVRVNPNDFK